MFLYTDKRKMTNVKHAEFEIGMNFGINFKEQSPTEAGVS